MTQPSAIPHKRWIKGILALFLVNFVLFAAAFLIFNERLPDIMPTHFNVAGDVDDTAPKWQFWLMYGGLAVLLPSILSATRFIDPRKENYARFESFYSMFRWAISLFLHGVFVFVILHSLGYSFPMNKIIVSALGLLWIVVGNRMGQVRSNFFMGIRTPWAIMDENNWNQTHRLAAKLWVAAGLLMLISAWIAPSSWTVVVVLVCALGSSLAPVVYSYSLHRRKSP
ncbi:MULTISPECIES: SdpI family protein [Cohnella]|uniref:SdpI family protein n=1 Tax=Cohnella TaxID=329857 RepID=UPI0009B9A5B7|nr:MULTISPECIES: SdpI family protein [Cohnella]MBN2980582.1 SdpI family protein [Cohnella algarum]